MNSYFNYEARYQFVNYLVYLNADIKPINFYNFDLQFFISTINSIIEFFILILKNSLESLFYLFNIKPTPIEFILDYEGMPFLDQPEQEANEEKRNHILLMEKDEAKKKTAPDSQINNAASSTIEEIPPQEEALRQARYQEQFEKVNYEHLEKQQHLT